MAPRQTCQTPAVREPRSRKPVTLAWPSNPKGATHPGWGASQYWGDRTCGPTGSLNMSPESEVTSHTRYQVSGPHSSNPQILKLAFWARTLFQNRVLHLWNTLFSRDGLIWLCFRGEDPAAQINTCVCVRERESMCACVRAYMCMCERVHVWACVCARECVHLCESLLVCMCERVHKWVSESLLAYKLEVTRSQFISSNKTTHTENEI